MLIVGAGMAGLLAGNMLLKRKPVVIEAQSSLPNNHSAVLRFRSSVVGDVLGIPFKKVSMIKTSIPWRNPVADALGYSFKNTATYRSDRSITSGLIFEDRFIAPPNLIALMAEPLTSLRFATAFSEVRDADCTISTIPMPALMKLLEYPHFDREKFTYSSGFNVSLKIADCDAYASLLVPDPSLPFSRASLTGDELIIECLGAGNWTELEIKLIIAPVMEAFGINRESSLAAAPKVTRSKYAKIDPIDDQARKDFMHWATDKHGIFSLGRFATWRPGLLLDDLVKDVRLIDNWSRDRYGALKNRR